MKKTILLVLIFVAFNAKAQLKNVAIRVAATLPVINSTEESAALNMIPISPVAGYSSILVGVGSIKQSFNLKVGFDISGRFNYFVSGHFFLGRGLSATCIRFQRSVKIESLNEISQPTVPLFPTLPGVPGVPVGSMFGTIIPRDANGQVIDHIALSSQSSDLGNTNMLNLQLPVLACPSCFKDKPGIYLPSLQFRG